MTVKTSVAFACALLCIGIAWPATADLTIRDDTGREVRLPGPAQRIISLAPHVTEILFAAGAGERVVGVVAYSDYPPAAQELPQVGGYSNVDMEAVAALKPDLVIAWQSGNRSAHLGKIEALGIPVYVNEARSLDDVARSIERFGRLAGTDPIARQAAASFRARKETLAAQYQGRPLVRMFYQIWDRPLMTVNGEHLISDVIRLCGGDNVFAHLSQLAPTIGVEGVLAANPEVIIASGSGAARPDWLDQWMRWPGLAAHRANNIYVIPPELIQRHTPRILDGATQLCAFLEEARGKRTLSIPTDTPDQPRRERR